MPSRASRAPPLKVGDKVSMAVSQFGEEYVRGRASCLWALDEVRDDGVVVEEQDGKYLIKSVHDTETHFVREEGITALRAERRSCPCSSSCSSCAGEQ